MSASSKGDLCQAEHLPLVGNNTWKEYTGFQEYCMLSKSDTAVMCPDLILKEKNKKNKQINKVFGRTLRKKVKQKKIRKKKLQRSKVK